MKSGVSCPIHFCLFSSHQTNFLRSDQGLPSVSAEARLYKTRAIVRPSPSPLRRYPILFPMRLATGGHVFPVAKSPRIDPAAAGGRAIVF